MGALEGGAPFCIPSVFSQHAQGRLAQESAQLYYAIMNSLYATGRANISVWSADYTIPNGQPNGLILLKVIIRESGVDTQATAA